MYCTLLMLCSQALTQPPLLEVQHFMALFIVTNSALIYWCTFSLLVEYKKLDIMVITHNFNVTPSVRNNEQL